MGFDLEGGLNSRLSRSEEKGDLGLGIWSTLINTWSLVCSRVITSPLLSGMSSLYWLLRLPSMNYADKSGASNPKLPEKKSMLTSSTSEPKVS
jgi:hypothetical protein